MANEEEIKHEEADIEERLAGFNTALKQLLGKYELALTAVPLIMSGGTLGAKPVVVSARKKAEEQKEEARPKLKKSKLAEA